MNYIIFGLLHLALPCAVAPTACREARASGTERPALLGTHLVFILLVGRDTVAGSRFRSSGKLAALSAAPSADQLQRARSVTLSMCDVTDTDGYASRKLKAAVAKPGEPGVISAALDVCPTEIESELREPTGFVGVRLAPSALFLTFHVLATFACHP